MKRIMLAGITYLFLFQLVFSQNIYLPGTTFGTFVPITVTYTGASGVGGSWIGLYREGAGDLNYLSYQYINESIEGSLTFAGMDQPGLYNFRLFRGGGYDKIQTSPTFLIRQGFIPDNTFHNRGLFRKDFILANMDDWATAVRITPEDKIVVAGTAKTGINHANGFPNNEIVVARFNPDGQPDPTFGDAGFVHAAFTTCAVQEARGCAVQKDGKVIVIGLCRLTGGWNLPALIMVRFNATGSIDGSFGTDGVTLTNFRWPDEPANFAWDDPRCIELLPDDRILVGGGSLVERPYSPGRPFIGRYTPNGVLDATFNYSGMLTPSDSISFRGYVESIVPPAEGGDGSFMVGITSAASFGMNHYLVYKLLENGSYDAGFGQGGILVEKRPKYHNNQYLKSLQITPSGMMVMMGGSDTWAIWLAGKSSIDGSDYSDFGNQGITYCDPTSGNDIPGGMAVTDKNKILVGLTLMRNKWAIGRFDTKGDLEPAFGVSFLTLMEGNNAVPSFVSGIGVQKSGYYVLVGGANYPSTGHYDFMVMRFKDNPEGMSGIGENPVAGAELCQNFPNPFTHGTTITWTQEAGSHVSLSILDILGNRVAIPVDEFKPAGHHRIDFSTRDTGKGKLPAGTYFYRICIRPAEPGREPYVQTMKMVVLPER